MTKLRTASLFLAAALGLSACNHSASEQQASPTDGASTKIATTTDNDGQVSKTALTLSSYAVRAALGNNPDTAAYVTIKNTGNQPDRLRAVLCACATSSSLHTMTMNGTMMEMGDAKDGFAIGPGETLVLAPGGNHIMLNGLTRRPKDGDHLKLVLIFDKAGHVDVTMPVTNEPLAKPDTASGH